MNRAQGNGRAKPDGFLHLNNFSHVPRSGLAGAIYERVMTEKQRELVELTLLELAQGSGDKFHFKHNVWRFRKDFLIEHFSHVVYSVMRSIRKSASQEVSIAVAREELDAKTYQVTRPSFR